MRLITNLACRYLRYHFPVAGGRARPNLILALKSSQIVFLQLFQIEQGIMRGLGDADQLIQFDLNRLGIPVLRMLDQEHY